MNRVAGAAVRANRMLADAQRDLEARCGARSVLVWSAACQCDAALCVCVLCVCAAHGLRGLTRLTHAQRGRDAARRALIAMLIVVLQDAVARQSRGMLCVRACMRACVRACLRAWL